MNTNEIKSMLERYNSNLAVVNLNIIEIESLQEQLKYANQPCNESNTDIYYSEVLKSKTAFSEMPTNFSNQFRSSTEYVLFEHKRSNNNDFDIEYIKSRLNNLLAKIKPYAVEIDIIDKSMLTLGEKEKFIIENIYKNKFNLVEVAQRYCNEYGFSSSKTISRMRDNALYKMSKESERIF